MDSEAKEEGKAKERKKKGRMWRSGTEISTLISLAMINGPSEDRTTYLPFAKNKEIRLE